MSIFRNRPTPLADFLGSGGPSRGDSYSDPYAIQLGGSKHYGLSDEGSYFTVMNTTPGTGIAGHAAPTSADPTKPFLWLFNGGTLRVSLDTLAVRVTAVDATGPPTSIDASVFTDTGATRASGGTQVTPVNVNSDVAVASKVTAYVGATVLVNSNAVHVAHRRVRSVIPVVQDHYVFTFGYGGYSLPAAMATTGIVIVSANVAFPPVIIGPGDSFIFVLWLPAGTVAQTYDVEASYIER